MRVFGKKLDPFTLFKRLKPNKHGIIYVYNYRVTANKHK